MLREEKFQRKFPFQITIADSAIDGKPAISLRYPADCPFPWPHISEEIREIEARRLLGLTLIDIVGLRRMALPFLLERRERRHPEDLGKWSMTQQAMMQLLAVTGDKPSMGDETYAKLDVDTLLRIYRDVLRVLAETLKVGRDRGACG